MALALILLVCKFRRKFADTFKAASRGRISAVSALFVVTTTRINHRGSNTGRNGKPYYDIESAMKMERRNKSLDYVTDKHPTILMERHHRLLESDSNL